MSNHARPLHLQRPRLLAILLPLAALLMIATACGGSTINPTQNGIGGLAANQVLILPNVGTQDIGVLDPALGADANSALAVDMIYSGLVKSDQNLNILPDQATWQISPDNKVYTFHLKSGITFSDGTPITAQTYVYTLTRALLPAVKSPIATFFEGAIVGANDVNNGKTKALAGVRAIDDQTLQITLTQPTPYFLEVLANSLYFALNQKIIEQYGQTNWINHAAGKGIGSGPFMVKGWIHTVKMILVPNPRYYGAKTRLKEVDMDFVGDGGTAFKAYRAGQYSLDWNILPTDLSTAKGLAGFTSSPLLQTDLLFFDNKMSPFDQLAVRQAFAYATDKETLAHTIFKDAVTPAATIIPPGMPGYQPAYSGLPYDRDKAKALLLSTYPDVTKVPLITFSYPNSQVSPAEAAALQQMWQRAFFLQVKLKAMDLNTYNDETARHQIQFGFMQWSADFPDPYDWLTLNLFSTAANNIGDWDNATFDQTVTQAEKMSGAARLALYNKAEQIAIEDVGWLPLDHPTLAAVIPSWVHGVSLNGEGLFFGDWSDVYLLQH